MTAASSTFNVNRAPIIGAGRQTISQGATPTPTVGSALRGWFKPMVIGIYRAVIEDGSTVARVSEVATSGIIQPGDPERLKVESEGERSWNNAMLHVLPGLPFDTGDFVKIDGTLYKVMESYDFHAYGYVQYELLETYANAATR